MASNLNEILGRNIDSVKSLKAAIKELQDSLVGLDTESQEYKDTAAKLATAQDALKDVTRAGIDANLAAKDSIVGMQKEYNKLYDAYKKLSDEQRNSDFGKNMAESLEKLSATINDSKKEVGNFTSNIGRYAQGATEAFNNMGVSLGALQTPMKMASGGAKTLGASLKALIANPVGAVIMAIVVAFKAFQAIAERVKKAINDNEESSNRLKVAMATFKPVVDAVSNAFDFLAKITVKVIEGVSKVAEKVMSIIPGMKKAIDSHKELAKATNDLTKATREANIENSKKTAEIERLREEASATEDVTEKKRLLEEAKAMQAEVDQKNIELAQEELRIMQEYAAKTANSAEANDKLAAAQKKVNDAIAQGEKNQRLYNKQLDAVKTTTTSAGKTVDEYKKKAHELYEQLIEDNKDELTKLTEKYEKEKKLLEKYHMDTKLLTQKYERDKKEIIVNTLENTQNERRAAYNVELSQYSKYISQQRELLQDDPVGLATFEKQISEEILERFEKIDKAVMKTQEALVNLGDGKNWDLLNAFSTVFYDENVQNISNYSAAIDTLKKKIAEFADYAEGTQGKLMHDIYQNALTALEKMSPEEWVKQTKTIQEQVDSLRTAYGISIDTMEEADRLAEIQKKNIEKMKKLLAELPAQMVGEEQIKRIQDAIKKNYEAELEGLIKTVTYDTYGGYLAYVEEQNRKALEVEKTAIEEQLKRFSGTAGQKLEIMQRYYEVLAEMREKDHAMAEQSIQRVTEMFDNLIGMTDNMASSLASYKSTRESVIDSEVKAGKISEAEGKRRKSRLLELEKLERDFAVATIAADAATGAFKIWKGWATETGEINPITAAGNAYVLAGLNVASTLSAVAKTAGLAATAAAQIAAAKGKYIVAKNNSIAESGGGGGSVSVGATPALIDTTPYTYSRTVQTAEEEDRLNAPIYVTVTDIEEGLGHRATVTNESSF